MHKYYNTAVNSVQLTRVCNFINRRLCLSKIIKTRINGTSFTPFLTFNRINSKRPTIVAADVFFKDGYFIDGINRLIKTFTQKLLKIRQPIRRKPTLLFFSVCVGEIAVIRYDFIGVIC